MRIGSLSTRIRALGAAGALGAGMLLGLGSPQVASAAGPTINASVVGNAGMIRVTGSGFPRNTLITIEFNPNFSDGFLQDFTVRTTRTGHIPRGFQRAANVTASCIMGVVATTGIVSNPTSNLVFLNTAGKGCTPATISAVEPNPLNSDRFTLTGSNFTPGGSVIYTFTDHATGTVLFRDTLTVCGTLVPGPYPPPPAGRLLPPNCLGVMVASQAICHESSSQAIDVSAQDDDGYTPTIQVFNQPRSGGFCP